MKGIVAGLVLLALLISLYPIPEASQSYFRVTNVIATPGGLAGFILDYSRAVATGALGGPLIEFYLSRNSYATITGDDVFLARAIVTPTTSMVFGTLRLPDSTVILSMLGSESGVLYVKATDGTTTSVASIYIDASSTKPFAAIRLSSTRIASEPIAELGVVSSITVSVDLTVYSIENAPWMSSYNAVILRRGGEKMSLVEYNRTRCHHISDVFWRIDVREKEIELSVMKSFPLNGSLSARSYLGVPHSYASYSVEFVAGQITKYLNSIRLEAGRQESLVPRDYEDIELKVSIAWPRSHRLEIYPVVSVKSIDLRTAGPIDEMNVGDRIVLAASNFPAGAELQVFAYALSATEFVRIGSAPLGVRTNSTGDARIELSVPPMQYGGRTVIFTLSGGEAVASATRDGKIFRERVMPYLDMWSYDDLGRPNERKHIAPGSYVLAIGKGFLAENLIFELVSAEGGPAQMITVLETVLSTGVLPNGSIGAILRVPVRPLPEALDEIRTAVRARGSGSNVAIAGRGAAGAKHLTIDFDGEAAVVYVNPRPTLRSIVNPHENVIMLGMPLAYPHGATWEPEELRRITIEAIGLPRQWAVRAVNVSLMSIEPFVEGYPDWRPVALAVRNQPVTYGYFMTTAGVPALPYTRRGYMIYVGNSTCCPYAICSNPAREAAIFINATLAAVGLDGEPRIMIALPTIRNVTLVGYGWAPLRDLEVDVAPVAGARNIPVGRSAANGTVRIVFPLEDYAKESGTYYVTMRHRAAFPELRRTVVISVRLLPRFHLTVLAPPESYADREATIWVIAKFDEVVASTSQVVRIWAKALSDGCEQALALSPYSGQKAIYRAKIAPARLCGERIIGGSILIEVEAIGRFDRLSPDQLSVAHASIAIRHRTLGEELSNITFVSSSLRALERALEGIVDLNSEMRALLEDMLLSVRSVERAAAVIFANQEAAKIMLGEVIAKVDTISRGSELIVHDLTAMMQRLSGIERTLGESSARLIAMSGDLGSIVALIKSVNASISKAIAESSGIIVMEVRDARGQLMGAIAANMSIIRSDISQLSKLLSDESASLKGLLRGLSDEMARLRIESLGRLSQLAVLMDMISNDVKAARAESMEIIIALKDIGGSIGTISSKIDFVGKDLASTINATLRLVSLAERLASKDDLRGAESRISSQLSNIEGGLFSAESSSRDAAALASQQRIIAVINLLLSLLIAVLLARLALKLFRS